MRSYVFLLVAACILLPNSLLAADISSCDQRCPPVPYDCTPPPTISGPELVAAGSIFTVENGIPDFLWSACGDYTISADSRSLIVNDPANCCGAGEFAVTDAGHRVGRKEVGFPSSALVISGTAEPIVGSVYSASGGTPPYTFSSSCEGVIDEDTGKLSSLASCCGSGIITGTDSCGQQASITVRWPSGTWISEEVHYVVGPSASGNITLSLNCSWTNKTFITTWCGLGSSFPLLFYQGDKRWRIRSVSDMVAVVNPGNPTTKFADGHWPNGVGYPDGQRWNWADAGRYVNIIPPGFPDCTHTKTCNGNEVVTKMLPYNLFIDRWVCTSTL